jgi:nucleotide-binding universal stress UspA family protein
MKKILVPVDFSIHSESSCRYALAVARVTGAELILFHSFFDQVYFTDGGFSTSFESGLMLTDEIILDFYKQKEALLKSISEGLISSLSPSERSKVKISCFMESGDPEVQIIKAIEVHHPDLIIMSSAGMGKKGILSGSVARRIINHTNIPVLAVPALSSDRPIKNVAYMSAFESNDVEAIRSTEELLAGFGINLFILHILTGKEETLPGKQMADLAEKLSTDKPATQKTYHLIEDNEHYDKLRHFFAENQIDLIVFIPHKRNVLKNLFHHGITKEDLFLTHIPILAART